MKTTRLFLRVPPDLKRAWMLAYPGRSASKRLRQLMERDLLTRERREARRKAS